MESVKSHTMTVAFNLFTASHDYNHFKLLYEPFGLQLKNISNFQSLEAVGPGSEAQLQVDIN